MIEDRSEDESKCKRKKSKKTEDKDKKSRRSNNKSSIRKSTKERTPKSKENDTAYALLKEQSKILDIMGSSPLIVSTVTPKAKKNLSSKGKDSDFKKKTKIKNALKKKRGTPKSIPVKNEDIKDTKILSEKSMTSLTISSMGDIGLDQAVASSVINEGEPIGNGGEDKVKKVQTKNENNEIRVSEKKKIKEKQEREPKHSLKILKKKVEKVDILLSELDISTDKYKKLSKKRAEYAKQLERLGVIGDHSNDDNHGESATKTENGNLEIELNHDEGGAIDGRYGFIGLNDSKGSDDRGENSPIDNIDGTPDWSKSSQAKADKEKRRQSSLGRHAERKKSMRETKKNKSIKTRTRGFRETRMDEDFSVPVFKKSKDEKKFLKGSLENDFVFQNLEPNSFKMFIDAFEEVEYQRGINVIKQGDFGDYFYVVAEGKVKFYVHGKRVGTGQRGRSFGEAALLYTAPRSATVTASETPTILYRVDQKTFKFITQNSAKELRQQKLELLRAVDFLSDLLYDDLQRLCDLMVPRSIAKGKYLYRKDADADAFYILQSGEMTATDIIVEDSIFEDIVIQPGDYFGQNALARDAPRENSVVALEDSSVYGIDRGTFDKVLGSFYNVILKTNDRQLLGHIDVIENLNLDAFQLTSMVEQVVEVQFFEGEEIFAQGEEIEPALYLIRDGGVDISAGEGNDIKTVQEDVYFGDDMLLSKADKVRARYTVTATEDIVCGCLTLKACRLVLDLSAGGISLDSENSIELNLADSATMKRRNKQSASFASGLLSVDDLEKIKIVGEGEYGQVWLTKCQEQDDVFALKIQNLEQGGESFYDNIKREVATIGALYHPYIVGLIVSKFTGNECLMVMNFITGGELWSVIHKEHDGVWSSGIPEADAKFYSLIIADTISYMHRRNILFRDLKPENVMIDNAGYPNIIDFGFAKSTTEKTYTFCGTPNYVAPEIVLNAGHGVGVDHWALGVVIYEMLSGENPFWYDGIDTMTLYEIIVKDEPYPLESKLANDVVEDLIDGLLEKDSSQRLGVLAGKDRDIVFHPWFNGLNLQELRHKKVDAPWLPLPPNG